MTISRRSFVKIAAAAAALPRVAFTQTSAPRPARNESREVLRELPYSSVQLAGGPFKRQYDALRAHYLALDNDRLLKVYRQRAGLPAPGEDMGGWYDFNGFVPGHALGQFISGLARIGASTGDQACHEKVHALVTGFGATLGAKNQSILRPETNLWPCYTLDKHFIGLIDSARLSNVTESKDLLERVLHGAKSLLPPQGRDRIGKKNPPYDETYVMPENLFAAHELTGDSAFHDLAVRYLLDREYFDPLARGENPLPGQHAYSHAIALSSAGKAFLTLGEPNYREAMRNAFTLLTTQQQFASGGWGPNETFIAPHRGELYASLSTTVDHFETPCGSYAATKLARYLLRTTSDPRERVQYADYLERVLYNAILAARLPDSDGDYFYYSTYSPMATKVYYKSKWPCCSGTLVQTVADYPIDIYMQSTEGIDVNLYIPSRATWMQNGVRASLAIETNYPRENSVSILVSPERPLEFTLRLRVPSWANGKANVTMGAQAIASSVPGTYIELRRYWKSGDKIQLTIPQDFRVEPIDEHHPETVALMRGPLQYVALNPAKNLNDVPMPLPASLRSAPLRNSQPQGPHAQGAQSQGAQPFFEGSGSRQVTFVPLYEIGLETYTSYFTRA
ncbi:MAG TPA: beta-L-arabinofuranosidase domain-containing protein [Candidatus Binatia bacterium]|nr:beta-L-arabinofuranosidase domain-containing protein [Candidatus Binatia bacterium]